MLRYGHSRHRRPAVDQGNPESAVRSLIKGVSDRQAEARRYLADQAEPDDASLIATCSADVIRYAGVVRSPAMPDFGAAAFRRFTGSRWPSRSGGGASRHCRWTRPGNWVGQLGRLPRGGPRRLPVACSQPRNQATI